MPNPVRNHLQLTAGKTGEHIDITSRHLCDEIKRVCRDYEIGMVSGDAAVRELDAVQALVTKEGTVLPAHYLRGEGNEIDKWLSSE